MKLLNTFPNSLEILNTEKTSDTSYFTMSLYDTVKPLYFKVNSKNIQEAFMGFYFRNLPYGRDESQKFDITCKEGNDVHAVIFIHGGAFFTGNKDQYPLFLMDYSKTQ